MRETNVLITTKEKLRRAYCSSIYPVSLSESYLVHNEWGPGSNEWKKIFVFLNQGTVELGNKELFGRPKIVP